MPDLPAPQSWYLPFLANHQIVTGKQLYGRGISADDLAPRFENAAWTRQQLGEVVEVCVVLDQHRDVVLRDDRARVLGDSVLRAES
jgi:hypothetical protein